MKKKLIILFLLLGNFCVLSLPVFAREYDTASPGWRPDGDLSGTGYMRAEWTTLDNCRSADIFIFDGKGGFIYPPEIQAEYIGWEFNIIIDNFVVFDTFKRGRLQISYEHMDGMKTCIQGISSDGKWEKIGTFDLGYGFCTDVYDFSWTPDTDSEIITIGWVRDPDKLVDSSNYIDRVIIEVQCLPQKPNGN